MTPEELKRYYTERYLPENIHENPLLAKYKNYVNLYEMGYWNFLNTVASREGFNFIQDGAPRRSHVSNGNAALLATLDLNTWEYHSTIAEGMQELPKLMVRQFANSSHRHVVHYNRRLVCIRKKQWLHGVYYELIFQHTETIDDIVYNITKSEKFCANKVILAVSPAAVKHIRFVGFEDNTPSITGLINAVLDPIPAMTAYLLFNESWWSGSRPGNEDVITDMSLRRIRYIASSRRKPRPDTESKRPEYGHLFLAANPDFLDVSYFDPLLKHGAVMHSECNLTKQGLLDLKTQFAKLQGLKDVNSLPDPIGIYVKDWRGSPSYAAWHLWKTGVRWDKEATRLRKPLPNDDIYLIGGDLCPGSCQLWVEGALQTVESLLESHFPRYYVMPLEGVTATADIPTVDDEVKMPLYN